MKKLSKLQINPENLIKDEELQKLRGGALVQCAVHYDGGFKFYADALCYGSQDECDETCERSYRDSHPDVWCFCNYGY